MPLEQESDSDDLSLQDLGEVTQFGLTNALSQMANLTFMAAAPGKVISSLPCCSHGDYYHSNDNDETNPFLISVEQS